VPINPVPHLLPLTAFVCTACVALCPLFRPYQTRLPPRGDVRVSGRANTPSWVYRRRAHGPTLECHHSRQLHSLSVSQFGLFLGALLSTHNSIMYATRRASGAVVRLSLNSFYIKTHSGNSDKVFGIDFKLKLKTHYFDTELIAQLILNNWGQFYLPKPTERASSL
jgi:hypothetical protein